MAQKMWVICYYDHRNTLVHETQPVPRLPQEKAVDIRIPKDNFYSYEKIEERF